MKLSQPAACSLPKAQKKDSVLEGCIVAPCQSATNTQTQSCPALFSLEGPDADGHIDVHHGFFQTPLG